MKIYICERCGNIVEMVKDSGVNPVCCGQKMTPVEAGTKDASREKHIPVVKREGDRVQIVVGAVEHPMSEEHSIEWIALETDKGILRKHLAPNEAPAAVFALTDEKPIAAYAYCNLHGLWRADVDE